MGAGTTPMTATPLPKAPGAAPDLLDPNVQRARKAALQQLAAKRGLQSTFLTAPTLGAPAGGTYGGG